jgi:hypothetical protein
MNKVLTLFFIFCICICSAQQSVITKLDKKTVVVKLFGMKNYSEACYITIQKNKRYLKCDYTPYKTNGIMETSKGKWKIKNDTLVLTEKFYKQRRFDDNPYRSFFFGKKMKRTAITKLILYNGRWMEIEDDKYIAKGVYDQYVVKPMEFRKQKD